MKRLLSAFLALTVIFLAFSLTSCKKNEDAPEGMQLVQGGEKYGYNFPGNVCRYCTEKKKPCQHKPMHFLPSCAYNTGKVFKATGRRLVAGGGDIDDGDGQGSGPG